MAPLSTRTDPQAQAMWDARVAISIPRHAGASKDHPMSMHWTGSNTVVLDLETARSADDCRHCDSHSIHLGHTYEKIGWKDHAALGLSIGCWYDYEDGGFHWFDVSTVGALIEYFLVRNAMLVTFNGRQFDCPLMAAVAALSEETLATWRHYVQRESYDILHEIWQADPASKYERGLNSLGILSVVNGYGRKEMDGAKAPQLWQAGRYAEVIFYNVSDVIKTRKLFEQICTTGEIVRGDSTPLQLPRPLLR